MGPRNLGPRSGRREPPAPGSSCSTFTVNAGTVSHPRERYARGNPLRSSGDMPDGGTPTPAIVGLRPKHIVDTCSATSQAAGTTLVLHPGNASDPWIQMRRCPSARVFFGGGDDDSWIPDGWVDLDVRPEGDGVAVTISADSVSKNIKLLQRTAAFAGPR
jgi:hypothetical protein